MPRSNLITEPFAWALGKSENYILFESQGHYLTLAKGHSDFKIKTCFSRKTIESFGTKFLMKAYG